MTDTWADTDPGERGAPSVFIQWKGTDVCLDFNCICGYGGHFDGGFAYGLRCAGCGAIFDMPCHFGLIRSIDDGAGGGGVQDTDVPHSFRPTNDAGYAQVEDL